MLCMLKIAYIETNIIRVQLSYFKQEREKAYGDYIEESTAKYAMNPQPVATVGGGKSSIPILGGISKLFG